MITPSPQRPASFPATGDAHAAPRSRRGPIRLLLDLFSSIWLGVTLLATLFIYSSIGSAGLPVHWNLLAPATWVLPRQWRGLEMTEFEWFHWWPFNLLIGLICLNLVVATLRRIPFKPVNYGVWMIHAGIITLCAGSVIYFGTKLEGDAPVIRRQVIVEVPGALPVALPAIPGATAVVGEGADQYEVAISETDPKWELKSEGHEGERAYSVSVRVSSPRQQFIRQLIWGYPQFTEDLVRSEDPKQPFARAKKLLGKPLVDETIQMSLAHRPQDYFYLMNSAAIYMREVGSRHWVQRPIHGLPRYNEYFSSRQDVWPAADDPLPAVHPLDLQVVPLSEDDSRAVVKVKDPLGELSVHVTAYFRFAELHSARAPGGETIDPVVRVLLQGGEHGARSAEYELAAFDPVTSAAEGGRLQFRWIDDESEIARLTEIKASVLELEVPAAGVNKTITIDDIDPGHPDQAFTPIEGTDYSYRVKFVQDGMQLGRDRIVSVASVEIKSPQRTFERWVFDDPTLNRDRVSDEEPHAQAALIDEGIRFVYRPGNHPPPVMILGGPGENDLRVAITTTEGQRVEPASVGGEIQIAAGTLLKVMAYAPRTHTETRPAIIPRAQRDPQLTTMLSMIRVEIPDGRGGQSVWLPYHHYAFESPNESLRQFTYRPTTVQLSDGRMIQIMFSRERLPLPAPVVLDDFIVTEHVGGYTGDMLSIRDWTSMVRFERAADDWTAPASVSMNAPAHFNGFWFFQSQWDPPSRPRFQGDPPSSGLNFTVLGVGNRNGVHVQLAGCCIAVAGMIYAFYAKPMIKRLRQKQAYDQMIAAPPDGVSHERGGTRRTARPAVVVGEDES